METLKSITNYRNWELANTLRFPLLHSQNVQGWDLFWLAAGRALVFCTIQMAASLWPPSHTGTRVSLEKCHPSPHGVYNYTDGTQEITDEAEMAQVQKTSLGKSAHKYSCPILPQGLETEKCHMKWPLPHLESMLHSE